MKEIINTLSKCNQVAVFDIDGTLIEKNIGVTFVKYLLKQKKIKIIPLIIILIIFPLYKAKLLSFYYAILLGAWAFVGHNKEEIDNLANKCFQDEIINNIYKDGINEINKCKSKGMFIILATGAHKIIADYFCSYVGADFAISTESCLKNNRYTFKIKKPVPYKIFKKTLVENYINETIRNYEITVYTDEKKDLELLKIANYPIGVNADDTIREYVMKNNGELKIFK
jgi:phosphoserine phosphatase